MPTVAEILKATGVSDEEIAKIDAKWMSAFSGVLTTAEQKATEATEAAKKAENERTAATAAREAAELAGRANTEFYETKIVPGLTSWDEEKKRLLNDKTNAEALAAFLKTQNDGARANGFIAADAPAFTPPADQSQQRDGKGQFVSNAPGSTPGSPTYIDPTQVATKIGDIAGVISDIQWKHQTLYGKPLPIAPSELIKQADALKLDPLTYASRTFNFAQKEEEVRQNAAKDHDNQIATAARAEEETKWKAELDKVHAEQAAKDRARNESVGNNPEVRVPPGSSGVAAIRKGVQDGKLPDPLKMTDQQRRQATRQQIHTEIAEREPSLA